MNGAFVSKAEVLDRLLDIEDIVLEQTADPDCDVTDEMARYALRALAEARLAVQSMRTFCISDFEIKRRNNE